MSDVWIENNLDKAAGSQAKEIRDAMKKGNVRKVYAESDESGTKFYDIISKGPNDVEVGGQWIP